MRAAAVKAEKPGESLQPPIGRGDVRANRGQTPSFRGNRLLPARLAACCRAGHGNRRSPVVKQWKRPCGAPRPRQRKRLAGLGGCCHPRPGSDRGATRDDSSGFFALPCPQRTRARRLRHLSTRSRCCSNGKCCVFFRAYHLGTARRRRGISEPPQVCRVLSRP